MKHGREILWTIVGALCFGLIAVAVTPYSDHNTASTTIDSDITNEASPGGITPAEVGTAMKKSVAMVNAITKTTSSGVVTYHAPPTQTGSAADNDLWFDELHDLLETAGNSDVYVLPAVLFQPKPLNTDIATVTADDVIIIANGAEIKSGDDTPGGSEIIEPDAAARDMALIDVRYDGSTVVQNLTYDGADWIESTSGVDHGALTGLGDDDHMQYMLEAETDARYFQQSEFLTTSAGAGNSGEPVALDAEGHIDATMIDDGDIDHTSLVNKGTNTHAQIDTHITAGAAHIADVTTNPHVVDLGNLGSGSLAELNAAIDTVDVDADTASRPVLNELIIIESDGTETRYDPTAYTAAAWFVLLHDELEALNPGDTVHLPPVLYTPGGADPDVIVVTATGVTIIGNGAVLKHGAVTPTGVFLTLPADCRCTGLTVANGDSKYTHYGIARVTIHGEDDGSVDTPALEYAIRSVNAMGGGIVHFSGTLNVDADDMVGPVGASNAIKFGWNEDQVAISFIGDGAGKSTLKMEDSAALVWYSRALSARGSETMFTTASGKVTGVPNSLNTQFHYIFDMDAAHGLAIGDWVYIWSEHYEDGLENPYHEEYRANPGELVQVATVPTANQFTTEEPVIDAMTTCNIRKMTPIKGFEVRDFDVLQQDDAGYIAFGECQDVTIANVNFVHDPADPTNTAHKMGFDICSSQNVSLSNLSFTVGESSGPNSILACIQVAGMCNGVHITDVESSFIHHCFDTAAHSNRLNVTEGVTAWADDTQYYETRNDFVLHSTNIYRCESNHVSETGVNEPPHANWFDIDFKTRIGTPRNININKWHARIQQRDTPTQERQFHTHAEGWGIRFSNCTTQGIGQVGFELWSRNTVVDNCRVTGYGLGDGIIIGGKGGVVQNSQIENVAFALESRAPDVIFANNDIRDCMIGVKVTSKHKPFWQSDNCVISGNRFSNKTQYLRTSAYDGPRTHVLIYEDMKDTRIVNNYMPRNANLSAIHVITPVQGQGGTIRVCSGNTFDGFGVLSTGESEAFYTGQYAYSGHDDVVDTATAAAWQEYNHLSYQAETPSEVFEAESPSKEVTNTTDYSGQDWKLVGTVLWRKEPAGSEWRFIFAQEIGAGGSAAVDWLAMRINTGEWRTELSGSTVNFNPRLLPEMKRGEVYHFELEHDESAEELTLTVNGQSDTQDVNHASTAEGNFIIGDSDDGLRAFTGEIGVRFESPPGTPIFTYPDAGATLADGQNLVIVSSAGTATRYSPSAYTPEDWWDLIHTRLEALSAGDTVILPPILYQPDTGITSVIVIAAADVKIFSAGCKFEHGPNTPAGLLFTPLADTDVRGVTIDDGTGEILLDGTRVVRVAGEDTDTKDVVSLELAIELLEAVSGGTIYLTGTFDLDDGYSESASTITLNKPINLIGSGKDSCLLKLDGLGIYYSSGVVFANDDTSAPSGAPTTPSTGNHETFNVTAHGLARGDWVYIWSQELDDDIPGVKNQYTDPITYKAHPSELVQVAEASDPDEFTVHPSVYDAMTTCFIEKATLISGFEISGFALTQVEGSGERSLQFNSCRNFRVSDIDFQESAAPTTTGVFMGIYIKNSCQFTVEDCKFEMGTTTGLTGGACIRLVGACTYGKLSNIQSSAMHHHFDTGANYMTGVDDQQSGTMDTAFGNPRDIVIEDWYAHQAGAVVSGTAVFNTHDSGHSMLFRNCVANLSGTTSNGFAIRTRNNRLVNCSVRGDSISASYGMNIRGSGNIVTGARFDNLYTGILLDADAFDCEIKDSTFRDCSIGVMLQTGADDLLLANNVFDNEKGTYSTSSTASTHILFFHDDVYGLRVVNNDLHRGVNQSAVHLESYDERNIKAFTGNNISGWGLRDGLTEAFYEGTFGTEENYQPSTDLAEQWQSENNLGDLANTPSLNIPDLASPYYGTETNSTDYSGGDWTLEGTVTNQDDDWIAYAFSQLGGGGSARNWLGWATVQQQWFTELDGGSAQYFDTLPASLSGTGKVHNFTLFYDQSETELTLTIDGHSQTLTCEMDGSPAGDFYIGAKSTGSVRWRGDLGVRLLDASGDEVFTYPADAGAVGMTTQAVTAVGDTVQSNAAVVVLNPDGNYDLTSDPQVADGDIGQVLTLIVPEGEANTITFDDGTGLQLSGSHTLGDHDTLRLIYNGTDWIEISFQAN